ncbi:hypothetical protein M8C17_28330 [Micromonospora sp. RHAY321]|uniref:hypothetical protein n=1 Tax=Micromonospora sp. RHAY321 TaxID=2944807 RepID=UPI00207C22D4|nr:hypothetical protein [Micromonospora sp. RHAY321]MCO1599068.1 hypothetical protein [Micromonospora sp. RHAY321]
MQRDLQKQLDKYPVRIPVQGEIAGGGGIASGGGNGAGGGSVTGSELELVAGWIVDWIYEGSKNGPGYPSAIGSLIDKLGLGDFRPRAEPQIDVAIDFLKGRGCVDEMRLMGGGGLDRMIKLTEIGRTEAVARLERRKDSRARRMACRDAVLRWVYERDANGESTEIAEIATSPYGWFNGELFGAADLVGAVQFLRERRLLGGTDETPTIEPAGTECIEQYGGVVSYLNRGDGAGVNVTVMGDNKGQLAVANRDVAQNQTNTNDAQVLTVFAEALREFARLLPEDQQPQYETVAAELEREAAKDEPDKGWVRSLLARGKGLLEGAPEDLQHLAQVAKIGFDLFGQGLG